MKHIAIIPNYSGITDMIKGGEISHNFLVKAENDQKVYFSNSNGYKLVVSGGDTYNMYKVEVGSSLEASFAGTNHIAFQILDANGVPVTTRLDWYCSADNHVDPDCSSDNYTYEGSETGVTDFEVDWAQIQDLGSGDTYVGYEVEFEPDGVDPHVNVMGFYYMTDEEVCSCARGTWDPENQECVMPTCAEQGLCGDDPYNCHECTCEESYPGDPASICDCEGGYYWGDECHEEPEPEDPCEGYESQEECECAQQGGTWEGSECVMPTCEDQGLCDDGEGNCVECESEDPCAEYEEGTQEKCECQGGTWDGENCNLDDPCGDASPEECECIQQGGTWDGSHGSSEGTCSLPSDDPCADAEDPNACECEQQGGTWDGSACNMPSDEQ